MRLAAARLFLPNPGGLPFGQAGFVVARRVDLLFVRNLVHAQGGESERLSFGLEGIWPDCNDCVAGCNNVQQRYRSLYMVTPSHTVTRLM